MEYFTPLVDQVQQVRVLHNKLLMELFDVDA